MYFSPKSNCVCFYPYKKVGDTPTRNNPCTNKIVTCKICNVYTWKYNLKHHFQKDHEDEDCSEEVVQKEKDVTLKAKI